LTLLPPSGDQLELTLIGPGFGESSLIHIGDNRWIVVDSCIDSHSGRPAALTYLESIGVDPSMSVEFILATHWHDDHIGGMSELLTNCSRAQFGCASALNREEFLKVASIFDKTYLTISSSGVSEIQKVFKLLVNRGQVPKYGMADRPIFTTAIGSRGTQCRVTSLSPSDAEYHRFLTAVSALMPRAQMTKFRAPDLKPNDLSVAAWVRIGTVDILLGADLEEHHVASRGWTAVIDSGSRPQGRAVIFKVAHHGSVTGHHDGIWSELLTPSPLALITPWNRGSKLPTDTDCKRIEALTDQAYVTSRENRRPNPLPRSVAKTMQEAKIKVKAAEPTTGFVQLRKPNDALSSEWVIALSSNAERLGPRTA